MHLLAKQKKTPGKTDIAEVLKMKSDSAITPCL